MFIGLTGGIGAGKSTVTKLLAQHGAVILDADAIARDVVAPGTPGLQAVAEEFPGVVVNGELNRGALASIVFTDLDALDRLEAITHPLIRERTAQLADLAGPDAVVIHDLPLLVETGSDQAYDLVVVVAAEEEVRRERLRRDRGMSEEEITARMAVQASDEDRRAVADVWIDNSGDLAALGETVRTVWDEIILPRNDGVSPGA